MYRHIQIGYLTLAMFSAAVLGTVVIALRLQRPALLWIVAPLLLVAVLFATLTIELRDGELRSHFGPGFWRKRYPLTDIAGVASARSAWWEGWGIRVTPRGMLYNVSGTEAVEIRLRSGTRFRLGSDEPEVLLAAIRAAASTNGA